MGSYADVAASMVTESARLVAGRGFSPHGAGILSSRGGDSLLTGGDSLLTGGDSLVSGRRRRTAHRGSAARLRRDPTAPRTCETPPSRCHRVFRVGGRATRRVRQTPLAPRWARRRGTSHPHRYCAAPAA